MRRPRKGRSERRGFTLFLVVLVLALILVVGSIVVGLLTAEQKNLWLARLSTDGASVAEGGFMEVLDDSLLLTSLPNFTTAQLSYNYVPSPQSVWNTAATGDQPQESYAATVSLVRTSPLQESGLNLVTAFVYEIHVESSVNSGQQTGEVDGEVFRVVSLPSGTVLPSMYAR